MKKCRRRYLPGRNFLWIAHLISLTLEKTSESPAQALCKPTCIANLIKHRVNPCQPAGQLANVIAMR